MSKLYVTGREFKKRPRRKIRKAKGAHLYISQKDLYIAEFGKEMVEFYYKYIYKPKEPAFISAKADDRPFVSLFRRITVARKAFATLFVAAMTLFLLPTGSYAQIKEEKTITGYVKNTQGKLWNGAIIELYEEDNLLGRDTLENGYFRIENVITGAEEENGEATPSAFKVYQNYPNPFNPETTIRYELSEAGRVSVRIYDITGREIRELFNGRQEAGAYELTWDARSDAGGIISSGVYIYAVTANGRTEARKMIYEKHGADFEWGKASAAALAEGASAKGSVYGEKTNGHWAKIYGDTVMTTVITGLDFSGEGTVELDTLTAPGRPIIKGFVYDLANKYDENNNRVYPIPGLYGQKVYLGSDTAHYVITDSAGMFRFMADTLRTDTIFVTNREGDSAYYNWKREITLTADEQTVTAFNDTTGIPVFKQWVDTLGIDFLEHLQYVADIENRMPTRPNWRQTMQRFIDDTIKIWLNRENQPNDWYADSAWVAIKTCETGRIRYVETSDSASSHIQFRWDHIAVGETYFISDYEGYYDVPGLGGGPYLHEHQFRIRISGPPNNAELPPEALKPVVAHEILHTIYALGRHSPHIQDEFNANPITRAMQGYPLGPNEREKRGMKLIYDLERNPKLLDYYK